MKSKFSTSIKGGKVKLPTAFPEKGLYMLATILKSPQAVQATLATIQEVAGCALRRCMPFNDGEAGNPARILRFQTTDDG